MIITNKKQLQQKCKPCKSIEEGEEIGAKLLNILTNSKTGLGLAANQIGIDSRVCVINCKEPVVLINPKIIEHSEEKFAFMEGCLSFPNEAIKTERYKWVKVQADNHDSTLFFSIWDDDSEEGYNKNKYLQMAYETACVQHEIDHLDGYTMFDRELISKPWKRKDNKIGRNEKVLIKKGVESKTIKYKKFEKMEKDGWTLAEV